MTRSWWMSGAMRSPANSRTPSYRWKPSAASPRTSGNARTRPVRRTSPTQPSSRVKIGKPRRHVRRQARPRRDVEAVIAQDADRRAVGAQRPPRLVDDHPEQLLAVVGCGQPLGDPEDGVQPLGELDLDGRGRRRPGRPGATPATEQSPEQGRRGASTRGTADRRVPGTPGPRSPSVDARSRRHRRIRDLGPRVGPRSRVTGTDGTAVRSLSGGAVGTRSGPGSARSGPRHLRPSDSTG